MQETWAWSLGWEDPLEKGMATHSSVLAWKIPWTEEPGGIQSTGSQRDKYNWTTKPFTVTLSMLWELYDLYIEMLRVDMAENNYLSIKRNGLGWSSSWDWKLGSLNWNCACCVKWGWLKVCGSCLLMSVLKSPINEYVNEWSAEWLWTKIWGYSFVTVDRSSGIQPPSKTREEKCLKWDLRWTNPI